VTDGPNQQRDQHSIEANVERLSRLYAAVVADCCDAAGYRNQIMRHDVKPLTPDMRVVGVAQTALCVEVYSLPETPYLNELRAVDALRPLDLLVATTNGATSFALWGELLSTCARTRGAAGAVIDGFCRDARQIIMMGFATFCTGLHLGDTNGRGDVIASGVPIQCGGVKVYPGDYLIGDIDGVCVIPQQAIAEVLQRAEAKVEAEDLVRSELAAGRSVLDTYNKYGVL
jgi:4-hydroxy-4-methyl-2-oxoglutarate aldolase